ncbi:leucine Rich Repeat family protein [Elysia marginata]|uniref:Leucine Rich Repeat family protein n=1 Tax=Elysia marginata TaxID=1093978 RepID=A0AAV4H2F1_9GAST|nr:leucine Rich Repeat family protein [Elysia marginata]
MAASLEDLYLCNNKIKDIGGKFKFLSDLQFLDLSGNNLESLERSSLQGLIKLKYLDLRKNDITHISDDAFTDTKFLCDLYLDGNRITSLGWILRLPNKHSLGSLYQLKVGQNQLTTVPPDLFIVFPGLNILYLSGNPLQCSDHMTHLQQTYSEKLLIGDTKCRPSLTVTNKFATWPVSHQKTPRTFDMSTSPLLVTKYTLETQESRKSTDVGFPSTRNTTESRKSTDVVFPSTRNTTESRKSTDVNFPPTPEDSSRSKTIVTGIVISMTLLVVYVVCAVTVVVLWRRRKKQGKGETVSQPTPGTSVRYSRTDGIALTQGLLDS